MFGDQLPPMSPVISQLSAATTKKKSGMFGSGVGAGELIQAILAGALAGRGNPAGAMGLQMLQQKRQEALEEAKYQNHRKDNLADYAEQQKLQQLYGPAAQPHYFEDNSGNQWAIGPDGVPKMVHKDDLPFKLVPNGMGGVVPVDLRSLMAGQGPKPAPQGVTFTPIDDGGPPPQGAGGFRY